MQNKNPWWEPETCMAVSNIYIFINRIFFLFLFVSLHQLRPAYGHNLPVVLPHNLSDTVVLLSHQQLQEDLRKSAIHVFYARRVIWRWQMQFVDHHDIPQTYSEAWFHKLLLNMKCGEQSQNVSRTVSLKKRSNIVTVCAKENSRHPRDESHRCSSGG